MALIASPSFAFLDIVYGGPDLSPNKGPVLEIAAIENGHRVTCDRRANRCAKLRPK